MHERTLADCTRDVLPVGSTLDLNSPWIALDRFIRELEDGHHASLFSSTRI